MNYNNQLIVIPGTYPIIADAIKQVVGKEYNIQVGEATSFSHYASNAHHLRSVSGIICHQYLSRTHRELGGRWTKRAWFVGSTDVIVVRSPRHLQGDNVCGDAMMRLLAHVGRSPATGQRVLVVCYGELYKAIVLQMLACRPERLDVVIPRNCSTFDMPPRVRHANHVANVFNVIHTVHDGAATLTMGKGYDLVLILCNVALLDDVEVASINIACSSGNQVFDINVHNKQRVNQFRAAIGLEIGWLFSDVSSAQRSKTTTAALDGAEQI